MLDFAATQDAEKGNIDVEDKVCGIRLSYEQSHTAEPRMVFRFDFVKPSDIEINVDEVIGGMGDRVFVVHRTAILKCLGGRVEVDEEDGFTPVVRDRHGDLLNPAA